MIPASDLRLGNWVDSVGGYQWIEYIGMDATLSDGHLSDYEQLKPIALSPEILENAGFVKQEWATYSERLQGNIWLTWGYVIGDVYCFDCKSFFPGFFGRRCTTIRGSDVWGFTQYGRPKYLHQLQNIYYAITGQELEIKNL